MTLSLTKARAAEPASQTTVQDHHLKAAEHLDQASISHREAAKLIQGGDTRAASSQAKLAAEHTAYAAHQVAQADRKHPGQAVAGK